MSESTKYVCTLDKTINHCPYFDGNERCTNNGTGTKCGMLRIVEDVDKKYIRKERWYEKYYK